MSSPKIYARRAGDIQPEYRDPAIDYEKHKDQAIYVDEAGRPILGDVKSNYDTSNVTWWKPSLKTTEQIQLDKADQRMIDKRTADEYASQYSGSNLFTQGLMSPMNFFSPSQQIGALFDYAQGERGYWEGIGKGNSGFVSDQFAKNYPYLTIGANLFGDAATGYGFTRVAQNLSKLNRLEKWYTGVPHRELFDNPGMFMDENFPNYTGTRWLTNERDYARGFSNDIKTIPKEVRGKNYKVYVDPEELKTLDVKTKSNSQWDLMPFKVENNKLVNDDVFDKTIDMKIGKNRISYVSPWEKYQLGNINNEIQHFVKLFGRKPLKTDDIVEFSKNNGYTATRLHNILDGGLVTSNGKHYVKPIEELILHENTPAYLGNSRFDVAKQLNWSPTLFTYTSTLGGLNGSWQ